ncbi:MAG: hypothetical protein V4493_10075 [Pseudomonadota bacterium]
MWIADNIQWFDAKADAMVVLAVERLYYYFSILEILNINVRFKRFHQVFLNLFEIAKSVESRD